MSDEPRVGWYDSSTVIGGSDVKVDFKVDIKRDYREDPREYSREYFMELKVFRWTQEEVIWVRNVQGWFQLKFKGSTLYFKVDFTPHNSKDKSHLKFTELDINASQACFNSICIMFLSCCTLHYITPFHLFLHFTSLNSEAIPNKRTKSRTDKIYFLFSFACCSLPQLFA